MAMISTCGVIFNDSFIANFLLSLSAKEFGESVHIWQRYAQKKLCLALLNSQCIMLQFTIPTTGLLALEIHSLNM